MARDPLRGPWLASRLAPARVRLFARLRSTNDYAARAVEDGTLAAPALVAASLQTAGRGQHTHTWWSDAGSLCITLVLPADPALPVGQVPLRAGLAVAEAVAHHLPGQCVQVKWPNDVFVDGRKIAGLLCLRRRDADLIGIGLNVTTDLSRAPREIRDRATSLAAHTRHPPRRDEVLCDLWRVLLALRTRTDWQEALTRRHLLANRTVVVTDCGSEAPARGIVRGVDEEGRLLLEVEGVIVAVTQGTPRIIRDRLTG